MAVAKWLSPAKLAGRLEHLDTGDPEVGLALLCVQNGKERLGVADLARAKLQPREPTEAERAGAAGWPVTAADYRLVLAPGVPDPRSMEELFTGYDAGLPPGKSLVVAAVLTLCFGTDLMRHDMMSMATTFAELKIARARRCSSLAVLHVPGDGLSHHSPHVHACILSRVHEPCGFGGVHPDLASGAVAIWVEEWAAFRSAWAQTLA